MNIWKCSNCYREVEKFDNVVAVQCSCGYPMEITEWDVEGEEERRSKNG